MISKKKVTALALAGLFVTPVLAATEVDYNEIRSGDGYLTADDNLFSEALENSLNLQVVKRPLKAQKRSRHFS